MKHNLTAINRKTNKIATYEAHDMNIERKFAQPNHDTNLLKTPINKQLKALAYFANKRFLIFIK